MNLLDESCEYEDSAQLSSEIKEKSLDIEHSGNYFTDSNMYLTDAFEIKKHDKDSRNLSNSRPMKDLDATPQLRKMQSNNMDPLNNSQ